MQAFKKSREANNKDDKETFRNVIRNKFQEVADEADEMEIDNEEEAMDDDEEDDDDFEDDYDEEDEGMQEAGLVGAGLSPRVH
jgi:hypothetical protein